MTAGNEGSQDRRHKKTTEWWVLPTMLFFCVSPSLCSSSTSLTRVVLTQACFLKMLDCNLHRSLWSSCMDVPVLESEPRRGGWGRGGRGASCGLHFLWRENPARLSQEWNLKALSQCCFLFVHQVLRAEGECCQCFLEPTSLWNTSQNLLRIYLPNSPCVMDHSSWSENALWISILFYWPSCLPGSCSNVLPLVLGVYVIKDCGTVFSSSGLPGDGGCSLFSGLRYT